MSSAFERDTALEPAGDGRWRSRVPETWMIGNGPNGGWVAAVLTRAMQRVTDRPPRSLTVHFLAAPVAGPVEVTARAQRAGGTTTFLTLRMEQDGSLVALGLGIAAQWRDGAPEWRDSRPPEVPPPHECVRIEAARTHVPEFWRNYDGRAALGFPRQGVPSPAAGWIRTAEPHPREPALVAALTDAWLPVAFVRSTERVVVPTLDLTIHWRAPLDSAEPARDAARGGAPPHPWTLLVMRTTTAAGGVWEEDGELWSEDGLLLAQSRQLAILRRA